MPVDFQATKQRQQATWASGNYAVIAGRLQIVGESLAEAVDLRAGERVMDFRFRSAAHWIEVFRRFFGPTLKAYAALDAAGQARLTDDIKARLERLNVGGASSLVVPSEYLEVVIYKS